MSNTQTAILLLLVLYLVPLSLMFIPRIWIKVYFSIVLAAVLLLAYQTHVALQAEDDCRAGCALAIGAMALVITTIITASLLAMWSALGFKKWRTFMANKRLQPIAREDSRSG